MPEVLYVNLYGPTEMTGNCTYYLVGDELPEDGVLPIGKPFRNSKVLLLDAQDHPVDDQPGEICILGPYLASGYYRMPELTAAAFTQNPLNPHYPEVMYRTGDYARYNDQGDLLYCGRRDDQVKHMGYRIELGEIETAANSLDGMHISCCLYEPAAQQIILLHESEGLSERDIMLELGRRLPKWMCPHRIISLETMPMNKNGKIDRARLREEYLGAAG